MRYAILSHRWLPRGEPTFQDMASGMATGPGHEKLRRFCEEASSHGFQFSWSDTCCIDKTSSSELDEAIRSIFRWYSNAAICIIHLAQTTSVDCMGLDEWFQRGWTLQELLAPPVVKFFNANWRPLTSEPNDKRDDGIMGRVAHITGCGSPSLRAFDPGPFDVDLRMTWAARRKTTRGEDMAYSLMGIFDVTLQPAYGEGAERAFCRLVELIMQSSGNTSVLNWAGQEAASHNSRAFPSSPRCYWGHKPFGSSGQSLDFSNFSRVSRDLGSPSIPYYHSRGGLDLAMTSRGLRVPLVLLPAVWVKRPPLSTGDARYNVRLLEPQFRRAIGDVPIDTGHIHYLMDAEYALGVFNYIPPDANMTMPGSPALRKQSIAYLLWRSKPRNSGLLQFRQGYPMWDVARFHGWEKVSTRTHIHLTLETLQLSEAMIVSKELLEVVYL